MCDYDKVWGYACAQCGLRYDSLKEDGECPECGASELDHYTDGMTRDEDDDLDDFIFI